MTTSLKTIFCDIDKFFVVYYNKNHKIINLFQGGVRFPTGGDGHMCHKSASCKTDGVRIPNRRYSPDERNGCSVWIDIQKPCALGLFGRGRFCTPTALPIADKPRRNKIMSTAKSKTRKLTTMAMLVAISVVLLYLVRFPIFPAASFLEYDPADIPILIGAFLYGPTAGLILTVVASVIQGFTVSAASGWIGVLMHIFATGSMVLVAGNIYRITKTRIGGALGLFAGTLTMAGMMVVWNLIFTPIFLGTPREAVEAMILPIILPFNLIKAGVNSTITFFVYKTISRFVGTERLTKPEKGGSIIKEN